MKQIAFSAKAGFVFLFCCILFFGWYAQALADGLADARSRGRLRVGVKIDFPPFGYLEPTGRIQGFDADLARYLGKALFDTEPGVELVPVTSGGRIPLLYSEMIDIILASMTITEDRQRVLEFSNPYFISGSVLLTLKESPIQGPEDLSGKRIAVVKGAVQEKDLPLIVPDASLVTFDNMLEALQALRDKQVEALCQDDVVLIKEALTNVDLKIVGKPFLPRPYAMAVRKGEGKFLAWLNARLDQMKQDGTLGQLRRKHFGEMEADLIPLE